MKSRISCTKGFNNPTQEDPHAQKHQKFVHDNVFMHKITKNLGMIALFRTYS